jgi:hypothetical protein
VIMAAGLRATAKALEHPPEPKVGAPVLDPTGLARCWRGTIACEFLYAEDDHQPSAAENPNDYCRIGGCV